MTEKYDDMIHLTYPFSKKRVGMSMIDRAAQFSPFAALSGYEEVLLETSRLTQSKITLSEDEKYMLDLKQVLLMDAISENPYVSITYFLPDAAKSGGHYACVSGKLKRVLPNERLYILENGTAVPFDDVSYLDSDLFQNLYL